MFDKTKTANQQSKIGAALIGESILRDMGYDEFPVVDGQFVSSEKLACEYFGLEIDDESRPEQFYYVESCLTWCRNRELSEQGVPLAGDWLSDEN